MKILIILFFISTHLFAQSHVGAGGRQGGGPFEPDFTTIKELEIAFTESYQRCKRPDFIPPINVPKLQFNDLHLIIKMAELNKGLDKTRAKVQRECKGDNCIFKTEVQEALKEFMEHADFQSFLRGTYNYSDKELKSILKDLENWTTPE